MKFFTVAGPRALIAVLTGAVTGAALAASVPVAAQDLSNPDSDFVDTTSNKAWHAVVEKTKRGYLIGNPKADARLIMFTSYGCIGCHEFTFKGDPELDYALLAPGILSIEIRLRFNHPADMPLTLLAGCGKPARFKVNHAMFIRDQKRWMESWSRASGYNRDIWSRDTMAARNGLVSSLGFTDLMARRRGYSRMDLNTCLSDQREIARLRANAASDNAEFGLPTDAEGYAKPHFVLDGERLEGVRDWDGLYPVLRDRFKPVSQSD